MLHWNLCKKYHLPASEKWWEHNVEKVLQNEEVKILWDFKIQTAKHLAHNIPDITVVEKKQVWLWQYQETAESIRKQCKRSLSTKT